MNREIKFRTWEYGGMYYDPVQSTTSEYINTHFVYDGRNDCVFMQFTGLEDKNGVEIYELDIVQIPYIDPVGHIHYGTDGKKIVVEFENGMFGFHTNTKFCPLENYIGKTKGEYVPNHGNKTMYWDFIGKVIGNIYENPELINNK